MNRSTELFNPTETHSNAAGFKGFRLLKNSELPRCGDFFADEQGLQPWEGPTGFRADAFVKPIYRPDQKTSRKSGAVVFSVPTRTFNSQLG